MLQSVNGINEPVRQAMIRQRIEEIFARSDPDAGSPVTMRSRPAWDIEPPKGTFGSSWRWDG